MSCDALTATLFFSCLSSISWFLMNNRGFRLTRSLIPRGFDLNRDIG